MILFLRDLWIQSVFNDNAHVNKKESLYNGWFFVLQNLKDSWQVFILSLKNKLKINKLFHSMWTQVCLMYELSNVYPLGDFSINKWDSDTYINISHNFSDRNIWIWKRITRGNDFLMYTKSLFISFARYYSQKYIQMRC